MLLTDALTILASAKSHVAWLINIPQDAHRSLWFLFCFHAKAESYSMSADLDLIVKPHVLCIRTEYRPQMNML